MSTFPGKTVLITGGASGLGRLLGERALEAGAANLIIWDKDEQKLEESLDHFSRFHNRLNCYKVDVSGTPDIHRTAERVLSEIGRVDILFNNAGIVIGKYFHEQEPAEIEKILNVNISGVLQTTKAFLPSMIDQGSGHIVNISSAISLMPNRKMSVYAGSKWAVTGWSESLRLELESMHKNLHVTTVQPGYIDTGMFAGVKPPLFTPLLKPQKIADRIIQGVRKNHIMIREPFMVKLIPFLNGLLPIRIFDFVAGKIFRVYQSMETFRGRDQEPKT